MVAFCYPTDVRVVLGLQSFNGRTGELIVGVVSIRSRAPALAGTWRSVGGYTHPFGGLRLHSIAAVILAIHIKFVGEY